MRTGKKIAPVPVTFRGSTVNIPQVQVLVTNSPTVTAYANEGEAKLFYVEYTKAMNIQVQWTDRRCPPGYVCTSIVPVKVYVIDADDLVNGPDGWHLIDLGTQYIDGPRRLYFRFEYGAPNITPIPYPGGEGKG